MNSYADIQVSTHQLYAYSVMICLNMSAQLSMNRLLLTCRRSDAIRIFVLEFDIIIKRKA